MRVCSASPCIHGKLISHIVKAFLAGIPEAAVVQPDIHRTSVTPRCRANTAGLVLEERRFTRILSRGPSGGKQPVVFHKTVYGFL